MNLSSRDLNDQMIRLRYDAPESDCQSTKFHGLLVMCLQLLLSPRSQALCCCCPLVQLCCCSTATVWHFPGSRTWLSCCSSTLLRQIFSASCNWLLMFFFILWYFHLEIFFKCFQNYSISTSSFPFCCCIFLLPISCWISASKISIVVTSISLLINLFPHLNLWCAAWKFCSTLFWFLQNFQPFI